MNKLPRILKNASYNYIGLIVGVGVTVLLTPFLVRHLGVAGYAVWVLVHSVVFYLNFLDLGLYSGLVKYIAEPWASRKHRELNHMIGAALTALTVAGIGAFCCALFVAEVVIPTYFDSPGTDVLELKAVVIIFGIDLLLAFPASVYNAIFEGRQRFDILTIVGSIFSLLGAIATVILLELGFGLRSLAWLEVAGTLLGVGVDIVLVRRLYPELRIRIGPMRGQRWRDLRQYSNWSWLNELVATGTSEIDLLLIPVLFSVSSLTPYALIASVAALTLLVIEPLTDLFFPLSSELGASSEPRKLRELLMRGTKAVLLVSLPVATVAFFLGEAIVYVWIDSAEIVLPPYVMESVSLSYLVSAFIWTSSTILLGISRLKKMLFISLAEAVLALILIVFAVPTYGLLGLVMGFAVANGVISLFVLVPYTCRTLSLPVSTFLRSSLTDPVMAALPAVFVAALLGNYLPPASWPLLIAEVASILLLFGLSYFLFCIESQQRHQILRWAANRVGVY